MPLDNSQELFYQVDENDTEIGSVTRKQAHTNPNIIHRSIAILMINYNQEMLFQKRSTQKDLYPGEWSYAVGGHVTFGSSYEQTRDRELAEELGIKNANTVFLRKIKVFTGIETEMKSIYKLNVPSDLIVKIDPTETEKITWVPLDRITEFILSHRVANWTIEALQKTGYLI